MSKQNFFKKNLKTITFVLFFLFMIKTFQSCNRKNAIIKIEKQMVHLDDSLKSIYGKEKSDFAIELRDAQDSIKELNYLIKLANSERDAAFKRADAVQSTAEKVRKNTTIKIENTIKKDTISKK